MGRVTPWRHKGAVVYMCFLFSQMLAPSCSTNLSLWPTSQARGPGAGEGLSGMEGAPEPSVPILLSFSVFPREPLSNTFGSWDGGNGKGSWKSYVNLRARAQPSPAPSGLIYLDLLSPSPFIFFPHLIQETLTREPPSCQGLCGDQGLHKQTKPSSCFQLD